MVAGGVSGAGAAAGTPVIQGAAAVPGAPCRSRPGWRSSLSSLLA